MNFFKNPVIPYVFSMVVFGTIGLFARNIPLSTGETSLYRALSASVLIGLFLAVTKQKICFSKIKKELPLLILSGAAVGFNWIFLFEAYNYTTVSAATLSYYFAPVIVTLLSPLLFKEKMGFKQWICFIMSTVGIVLITGVGNMNSGKNHLIGILLGLIAAAFYAAVVILNKYIKNVGGIHRTFLQFIAAAVVLIPYVAFTDGINILSCDFKGAVCLGTVIVLHTGITYCLYFSSLSKLPGQEASVLSYIDPLTAVILSVTVLGEPMTLSQIIGGALILGFTLWNEKK